MPPLSVDVHVCMRVCVCGMHVCLSVCVCVMHVLNSEHRVFHGLENGSTTELVHQVQYSLPQVSLCYSS